MVIIMNDLYIYAHMNIVESLIQLNNLELAVSLAKRGNLPGAEQLVSLILVVKLWRIQCLIIWIPGWNHGDYDLWKYDSFHLISLKILCNRAIMGMLGSPICSSVCIWRHGLPCSFILLLKRVHVWIGIDMEILVGMIRTNLLCEENKLHGFPCNLRLYNDSKSCLHKQSIKKQLN